MSRILAGLSPLLLFLLVIEVVLPLVLFFFRDRVIFFPARSPLPPAGLAWVQHPSRMQIVSVVRPDGRQLWAYDVLPEAWDADTGPMVIFFHGNAGNIAYRAPMAEAFATGIEARVLMPDYSGYGGNKGRPSEAEIYQDGLAAFDHVLQEGVPEDRIIVYGESLGGAVALEVATRRRCAGVVLQSTFSSLSSMALRVYPWMPLVSLLGLGRFPNTKKIAELDEPILVAHGRADSIIPFSEGQKLHREAPDHALFLAVEEANHNDFFEVAGKAYLEKLRTLIRAWVHPVD